jgi:hypothetical protein
LPASSGYYSAATGADATGHALIRAALEARTTCIESLLAGTADKEGALRLVVRAVSSITNTQSPSAETAAAFSAELTDAMVGGSGGLRLLRSVLDACYTSHDPAEQHWIQLGGRSTPSVGYPSKRRFESVGNSLSTPPAVKPFGCGLYTSTAMTGGFGMWRMFLEDYLPASRGFSRWPQAPNLGRCLFPLPWCTWQLEFPEAVRVTTVDDARGWVSLLSRFPRLYGDQVYPDWTAIATQYDGVRVTLPAIVAIQGVRFLTPYGPAAPGFWDVETTFWLHWRVTGKKLLAKTV